jgi:ATP-dependent DNA helicase RecG
VNAKLEKLIRNGEGLTVEFKRCEREIAKSVYETVCAFSNRYGGHILLGVEDDGTVSGVAPNAVKKIKTDFANSLNNTQRFAPTLFIELEEAELDGKVVLWCHIPVDSQVVMFGGRIFDRAADGDIDITRNSAMITHIHQRKTAEYSERKIFPYAKVDDFDFVRLMPLVKRLAVSNRRDHPWQKMTDDEIIKSAGLLQTNPELGKTGYTLAAVLLFGREELIRACTPNYVTDAICRRENLDRYDDRLMVTTNLIDAYDQLIAFISKHTLDRFFLIDNQRVSARSWIARELVSNTLVHREYTSAYPAKIVIENDRIVSENWCLPKNPGRIDPDTFTPYPKNPLLANFFINIGRADVLGSGVRNLYMYTKIYSGGEPELIEGDIFRTIVPLSLSNIYAIGNEYPANIMADNGNMMADNMADKPADNGNLADNMADKPINNANLADNMADNGNLADKPADKTSRDILLSYLLTNGEVTTADAARIIGKSERTARRVLQQLVDSCEVIATGANRNRKYRAVK